MKAQSTNDFRPVSWNWFLFKSVASFIGSTKQWLLLMNHKQIAFENRLSLYLFGSVMKDMVVVGAGDSVSSPYFSFKKTRTIMLQSSDAVDWLQL